MRVAYLINRYPAASHSFIRREIAAVEDAGVDVSRFTMRPADLSQLPDSRDHAELTKTAVLLKAGVPHLLRGSLSALLFRPFKAWRGLCIAFGRCDVRPGEIIRRAAYFAEAAHLAKEIKLGQISHIHAHFGTNSAAVARIASVLAGVSYSFTVHGPDEFDAPQKLDLAGKVRDAKFCVAISSFGQSQLMRWSAFSDWNKIKVVRCGVDESFVDITEPQSVPEAPNLCAVSRLSGQKGIPLLLAAAAELKRRGRRFRLSIVGDGEMRHEVEKLVASYQLTDEVVLVGWADSAGVINYIRMSRAMVLPSFAEGLPVVIMEALALGRPVVASSIAGIPELVDASCGWLVPAGSIPDLVEAMEQALDATPEHLGRMGEIGRERVRRFHDSRLNGRHLADLFRMANVPDA